MSDPIRRPNPMLKEYFDCIPAETPRSSAIRALFLAVLTECPALLRSGERVTVARAFVELRRQRAIPRASIARELGIREEALSKWELEIGRPAIVFSAVDALVQALLNQVRDSQTRHIPTHSAVFNRSIGLGDIKQLLDRHRVEANTEQMSAQKRNWYRHLSHSADKLLKEYIYLQNIDTIPIPVPVDLIAELSLHTDYYLDEMDTRWSGWFDPKSNRICVNSVEIPTRRRYTLAHEIAHAILHRSKLGGEVHRDAQSVVSEEDTTIGISELLDVPLTDLLQARAQEERLRQRAIIETEANVFAGCLLMPFQAISYYMSQGVTDIVELADAFGVSKAAMRWRLGKLDVCTGIIDEGKSGQMTLGIE